MEHETAFGACRFFSLYIQQISPVNNVWRQGTKDLGDLGVELGSGVSFYFLQRGVRRYHLPVTAGGGHGVPGVRHGAYPGHKGDLAAPQLIWAALAVVPFMVVPAQVVPHFTKGFFLRAHGSIIEELFKHTSAQLAVAHHDHAFSRCQRAGFFQNGFGHQGFADIVVGQGHGAILQLSFCQLAAVPHLQKNSLGQHPYPEAVPLDFWRAIP